MVRGAGVKLVSVTATFGALGTALTGATRTNSVIPVPSGVIAGQVVLVHLYIESTTTVTPPSGFTEIAFAPAVFTTGTVQGQRVYWKRATGADSGTYTFTHASAYTYAVAARDTRSEYPVRHDLVDHPGCIGDDARN
jgi:hypothetical protein